MKDVRKREPVKADYVHALGLATYSFASCEWQVVWCCEKIRPGSLNKIVGDELTAGKIAKVFVDLTRNMPVETDEGEGRPSRWNTLRALRVLNWYSARD